MRVPRLALVAVATLLSSACQNDPSRLEIVGSVERTLVELVAPASETIDDIAVARGQHLQQGAIVARLDTTVARAEVARAVAAVAAAQDVARVRDLCRKRIAPPQDLERAVLAELGLGSAVFIAAMLTMGLGISSLAKTQFQAVQMSFFFFLPSMLLSGFMFPFEAMPVPAQWIGEVLPLTHFLRIVRGILLKGAPPRGVAGRGCRYRDVHLRGARVLGALVPQAARLTSAVSSAAAPPLR